MTIIAILQDARRPRCVDSQFPVDPRATHGAPRRDARAATRNSRPIPLRGSLIRWLAPRPPLPPMKHQPSSCRPQASTRNSRPIPLRGSLIRWLAPLALAERLFVVAQVDVFFRTAQFALRRPEFAPQPEHRAYAFDIQRGI